MAYDVKFAHGKKANVESALAAGKIGEDDFIVFSDTDDELGFVNHDNEVKRIKSRTNEDYTLNGTSLGALKDGDTIPAGTSIDDFIKMIITKPVHPEYIKPSIKIESSNKNKVYEIGSTVNTILTATFTKNDAGELKNISLSTGDSSEESPIVQEYEFEIESGNNVFSAIASFEEGAVKKNNLGEYDDTNSIKAGEVSCDETLFVGGYRYFYG